MSKKIHVCIVYNEPVNGWGIKRQYVSENGVLQIGGPGVSGQPVEVIDLSEVGVLGEMEDISRALQSQGYRASIFNVNADIVRFVKHLDESRPDVIFNLCESVGNESIHEMHAVGIFELMGIPYTGSEPLVLGTALNKVRVKEMLLYHGQTTPRYQLIENPVKFSVDPTLTFPLIVKPAHEDASIGIDSKSIVRSIAELKRRVRHIHEQFEQGSLVEEYIDGRELNVGILGNKKPTILPISEIDMSTLPETVSQNHQLQRQVAQGVGRVRAHEGRLPGGPPGRSSPPGSGRWRSRPTGSWGAATTRGSISASAPTTFRTSSR